MRHIHYINSIKVIFILIHLIEKSIVYLCVKYNYLLIKTGVLKCNYDLASHNNRP